MRYATAPTLCWKLLNDHHKVAGLRHKAFWKILEPELGLWAPRPLLLLLPEEVRRDSGKCLQFGDH